MSPRSLFSPTLTAFRAGSERIMRNMQDRILVSNRRANGERAPKRRQRCWRWPSSERQTRNRLAGVATATTEILVSRQDDGVKEGFTMGTRQASARLMGTSRYFSISRKTGSKFSPTSKATNGERRRRSVPRLWAPCPPGRRNVSERTASHVDQGGGNAERLGSLPMRG